MQLCYPYKKGVYRANNMNLDKKYFSMLGPKGNVDSANHYDKMLCYLSNKFRCYLYTNT